MVKPAPAKSKSEREVILAELRKVYRSIQLASEAISRLRTTTANDLREGFLMKAELNIEEGKKAVEAAAELLKR